MPRSPSIKSLIKDLESNELREVIVELCKLNPKNKQFLQLYLQRSDSVDIESIVNEAKEKIHRYFYGQSMLPKVDLSSARKTVNDYSKVLKEYPGQVAELKLNYIETGTDLTNDFGDMYEAFYSSLESMFESFCKHIIKHPTYFNQFQDRIKNLQSACKNIGWGYHDVIDDLVFELEETMKANLNR